MLELPAGIVAGLNGSRAGETITADAYVGDTLAEQGLSVVSWQIDWDASRAVQAQGTVTVVDDTGRLVPWVTGDALAPGSRLQLSWRHPGGTVTPLARMVITEAAPAQEWSTHPDSEGRARWVTSGARIELRVQDMTVLAARDRLQAKTPATERTVPAQVRALLAGIVPVVGGGARPKTVAAGTVFERERLDAVDDLLTHAGLVRRMDGMGVMHLVDPGGDSVWEFTGGEAGTMVDVNRRMSLDDVKNSVVAASSGGATEFVGRAYLMDGPERWGGPAGNCTQFYASPLIGSQGEAQSAAETRLRNLVAGRAVDLLVTALPHPGLELWDTVTVRVPSLSGATMPVTGQVVGYRQSGDTAGAHPMRLTVRVGEAALRDAVNADRGETR